MIVCICNLYCVLVIFYLGGFSFEGNFSVLYGGVFVDFVFMD